LGTGGSLRASAECVPTWNSQPNYGLAFGYLSAEEIMKKKVTLFIGAHLAVFASVAALAGYGGGR
jgi:hypothetical protein